MLFLSSSTISFGSFQTSTLEESKLPQVKEGEKRKHEHFDENEEGTEDNGYVPLVLDDRFQVVTASEAEKYPHPTPPNAKDFLQQTLYGRYVRRKQGISIFLSLSNINSQCNNIYVDVTIVT